jgi:hypothetical protein
MASAVPYECIPPSVILSGVGAYATTESKARMHFPAVILSGVGAYATTFPAVIQSEASVPQGGMMPTRNPEDANRDHAATGNFCDQLPLAIQSAAGA